MSFLSQVSTVLQQNPTVFVWFFFFIGACLASFFNVVSFRIPKMLDSADAHSIAEWLNEKAVSFDSEKLNALSNEKLSLSSPGSSCGSCGAKIKWRHNVPLFGYAVLRGRCASCGTRYSIQYPIMEAIGGMVCALTYWKYVEYGMPKLLVAEFFFMTMALMALMDFKSYLLLDELTLGMLWIGLVSAAFGVNLFSISGLDAKSAIFGAIVGYAMLWVTAFLGKLMKGREAMGGGDLKLLAALGSFLGAKGAVVTMFVSPFVGLLTWSIMRLSGNDEKMVPYGPSLMIGSLIYAFYGKALLGLLGLSSLA